MKNCRRKTFCRRNKFYFTILILNTITLISFAQTYQPFPVSNARWSEKVEYNYIQLWDTIRYGSGWCYALANDTLIGTQHYTLVGAQQTWNYDLNFSLSPSINYGLNPPGQIFGAIREDSTKKVWFRKLSSNLAIDGTCFYLSSVPLDSDVLLYDFDLQVGDSLSWTAPFYLGTKKVMAIDSVQYDDGIWRKRYRLWPLGEYWIEGIGCTLGLFGALTHPDFPCRLSCFWQNGQYDIIAPPSIYDYCDSVFSFVGIENVASSQELISISPNPATTQIQITTSNNNQFQQIRITNTLGQVVNQQEFSSNQISIDISDLPSGIYLIELQNEKDKVVKKFVKQ